MSLIGDSSLLSPSIKPRRRKSTLIESLSPKVNFYSQKQLLELKAQGELNKIKAQKILSRKSPSRNQEMTVRTDPSLLSTENCAKRSKQAVDLESFPINPNVTIDSQEDQMVYTMSSIELQTEDKENYSPGPGITVPQIKSTSTYDSFRNHKHNPKIQLPQVLSHNKFSNQTKVSDFFTTKKGETYSTKAISKPINVFDLGQKQFGAKKCRECGMCFNRSIASDRDAHRIYHSNATLSTKFPVNSVNNALQKGNGEVVCVENFMTLGHRILEIKSSIFNNIIRSKNCLEFSKNYERLRKFVDNEIGSNIKTDVMQPGQRGYIYFNENNLAIGFLITGLINNDGANQNNIRRVRTGDFPNSNQRYFLGVETLWVYEPFRRMKVASELLEAAKRHFFENILFTNNMICFSGFGGVFLFKIKSYASIIFRLNH